MFSSTCILDLGAVTMYVMHTRLGTCQVNIEDLRFMYILMGF